MNTHHGIVLFFLPDRGYGYLRLVGTREEFYFRRGNITGPAVQRGDRVTFTLKKGRQGYFADEVQPAGIA